MKKYLITGGKKLYGKVEIESAKNSVLALLAGALLTDEEVIIKNCPKIQDVISMIEILSYLGVKTVFQDKNLVINAKERKGFCVPKNLTEKLRSSIYLMGALVGKNGVAEIAMPGGCKIGARPIDIHINSLKKLGVKITEKDDKLLCQRLSKTGGIIIFPLASVGATVNTILATVLLNGKTIIYNCAKEPEIIDLAKFLNKMGAKISGAGTSRIEIHGVKRLHGTEYTPISDRIEAGTYLLASAITGGEIEIHNGNLENITLLAHKISNISCKIGIKNDIIYTKCMGCRKPFNIETGPFPKFSTDLQSQAMAYLSVCQGQSVIKETLFENRFSQVTQLVKMGANISVQGRVAFITGVPRLVGAQVDANDLRGGASLVLAGLNAEGQTIVNNVEHIERGYLNMVDKLKMLGAEIQLLT